MQLKNTISIRTKKKIDQCGGPELCWSISTENEDNAKHFSFHIPNQYDITILSILIYQGSLTFSSNKFSLVRSKFVLAANVIKTLPYHDSFRFDMGAH